MRYRSGAKPSRSGNDCTEDDQRETDHEALIGFDVVDPSDQIYEPTLYVSLRRERGWAQAQWIGSARVTTPCASWRPVGTKLRLELRLASVSRPLQHLRHSRGSYHLIPPH